MSATRLPDKPDQCIAGDAAELMLFRCRAMNKVQRCHPDARQMHGIHSGAAIWARFR